MRDWRQQLNPTHRYFESQNLTWYTDIVLGNVIAQKCALAEYWISCENEYDFMGIIRFEGHLIKIISNKGTDELVWLLFLILNSVIVQIKVVLMYVKEKTLYYSL